MALDVDLLFEVALEHGFFDEIFLVCALNRKEFCLIPFRACPGDKVNNPKCSFPKLFDRVQVILP